jgi:hypothetical protein
LVVQSTENWPRSNSANGLHINHPGEASLICEQLTRILVDRRELPLGLRLLVEIAGKFRVTAKIGSA